MRSLSGSTKNLSKLEYELKKLLGIPLSALFTQKCSNRELIERYCVEGIKNYELRIKREIVNSSTPLIPRQRGRLDVPQEFIDTIKTAKEQIKDLYSKIGIMHRELYELGTSNSKEVVAQRVKILNERKPLIVRCEQLYEMKEEYFRTGVLPEELKQLIRSDIDNEPVIAKPMVPVAATLKVAATGDLQLARRRQQLRSSITKTENLLNYQAISKLSEPHPMPEGPKRDKTEQRLLELKAEYISIVTEISKREENGKTGAHGQSS